ncbi:MAG: ABC transporter ATP-binding protein [Planctomycetes bacterium]|nr:ABC transporter ATP-binding protein [Planctomycetota bacterium]
MAAGLYKTYRLGRVHVPVLRGVDLTVSEGEFVAILGASGSGKSTLLHLLGGLDRPDKPTQAARVCQHCGYDLKGAKKEQCPECGGWLTQTTGRSRIEFRGTDINTLSRRALDRYRATDAGFVFQFYHLLPELSVLQNVVIAAMVRWGVGYLAKSASCNREAAVLLEQVGLAHRLNHRPAELSGGERQRVAIARALINEPAVLLADEPTGNLDRKTGDAILDMLLAVRAKRQLTMVVVTHDAVTAARADRVVRLVDGRVVGE